MNTETDARRLPKQQLHSWIPKLLAASQMAADAILMLYQRNDFDVEAKADHSPLTTADLASHQILKSALEQLTPDIPVLSEESNEIAFKQRQNWSKLWLIDPLDGTREFIKRNGEFTINIALVENQRATLGLIAVPVTATAYFGLLGEQALRYQNYTDPEPIKTRRPCPRKPTILDSRSHGNPINEAYFKQLDEQFDNYDREGVGSALKFCKIAEGVADFYPRFGPTSEWDTAAGQALVEAAGGRVWLADDRELRYNARESILNQRFLVAGDPDADWPRPPASAR